MKKLLLLIYFLSQNLMANDLPDLGSYTDSIVSDVEADKIAKQILYQVNQSPIVVRDVEIDELSYRLRPSLNDWNFDCSSKYRILYFK